MTRISDNLLVALLAGASVIGLSTSAAAQTAESTRSTGTAGRPGAVADGNVLESTNLGNRANESSNEILVTATRSVVSLQDVPMSVDVATGEQIQRLNIFDAKDVAQLSPGLELTNNTGRNNAATIRGVQTNPDSGAAAVVDFYFNEVPIDIQTAFTAIYDIDQIEVLRGPQGALRGRTSPGGAITLRTRRANLNELEGYLQATGSDAHAYNIQGAVSVPVIQEKLAIRLSALADGNRGNNVRNYYTGERSDSQTNAVRFSAALRPVEDLTINFTYHYLHSDYVQNQQYVSGGFAPVDLPVNPTSYGFPVPNPAADPRPTLGIDDYGSVDIGPRHFHNTTHLITVNADWDLGDVAVQAVYGHQRTKLSSQIEQTQARVVPISNLEDLVVPYNVDMGELRLVSQNSGMFNWTAGAYYYRQTGDVKVFHTADDFGTTRDVGVEDFAVGDSFTFIPVNSKTYALSGSASLQLTDKLKVEAAARYNMNRGAKVSETIIFGGPDGTGPGGISLGKSNIPSNSNSWTGGANATYEINPDLTTYIAYGRSFRGGTGSVASTNNLSRDLLVTGDETSDSVEVGVKTTFFDRRLSLNVAAFYQKYKNYISTLQQIVYDKGTGTGPTPNDPDGILDGFKNQNYAGDMKSKGVEVTLSGRPTDNWDFTLAGAWVQARYDHARMPCNDFNGDGRPDTAQQIETVIPVVTGAGNVSYCIYNGRPTNVPDFSFTANTEYRFALGPVQPFIRGLVTYRPGVTTETGYRYRSRTQVNLFAGLRGHEGAWEISAFVKNLLNQKRITNDSEAQIIVPTVTLAGTPGDPYNSGYRAVNVNPPREWGLTGTFRF